MFQTYLVLFKLYYIRNKKCTTKITENTSFMEQSFSSEPDSHSSDQKLTVFYEMRRLNAAFQRDHTWTLS
jgi:hypothetical protein